MKYLFIMILFSSFIVSCDWQKDARDDYPTIKEYIPEYEREFPIHYYLDSQAVQIDSAQTLEFKEESPKEYNLQLKLEIDGIENPRLSLESKELGWLKLEEREAGQWRLVGTAPKGSASDSDSMITISLLPGSGSDIAAVERLKYYNLSKNIYIHVIENGEVK